MCSSRQSMRIEKPLSSRQNSTYYSHPALFLWHLKQSEAAPRSLILLLESDKPILCCHESPRRTSTNLRSSPQSRFCFKVLFPRQGKRKKLNRLELAFTSSIILRLWLRFRGKREYNEKKIRLPTFTENKMGVDDITFCCPVFGGQYCLFPLFPPQICFRCAIFV